MFIRDPGLDITFPEGWTELSKGEMREELLRGEVAFDLDSDIPADDLAA